MQHYLVPQQQLGEEKDLEYKVTADSLEDAEDWFVDAKDRLLDVNNWKQHIPQDAHTFNLTDKHGKFLSRTAHPHDHIRIDQPGPGPREINAHDWVVVEAIEYDDYPDENRESFALKLKWVADPELQPDIERNETAASGTLVIERRSRELIANYHCRNSVPTFPGGEWMGITEDQWMTLISGLLL